MKKQTFRFRPTQAGKTTETALWAFRTGGLVVCATQGQADKVLEEAGRLGLKITKPVAALVPDVSPPRRNG